jgi:hypothetical protein
VKGEREMGMNRVEAGSGRQEAGSRKGFATPAMPNCRTAMSRPHPCNALKIITKKPDKLRRLPDPHGDKRRESSMVINAGNALPQKQQQMQ